MAIKRLKEILESKDENQEIMILDGFNGSGSPREINLICERTITEYNANDSADCEDRVGETVLVLGHGYY